jgi:hypothetical protein
VLQSSEEGIMRSFIAAVALQQLRDMEELQRDLGRKRDRSREPATRRARRIVLRQGRRGR